MTAFYISLYIDHLFFASFPEMKYYFTRLDYFTYSRYLLVFDENTSSIVLIEIEKWNWARQKISSR